MKKNKISATIIADSINEQGNRITTFLLVFPRIVLAEFNTHRALSKNSASSRAIPFMRMLRMVMTDPFIPIAWMKDHTGMQGSNYFTGKFRIFLLTQLWLTGRNFAVLTAWLMYKLGLTKQIVNRKLEPYMWHTVIVTATEWENYFSLRAHEAAEIHIRELAYTMLETYNGSTPKKLKAGEWHIPFGDRISVDRITTYFDSIGLSFATHMDYLWAKLKIATARCARLSYLNFMGKDDYAADIKLYSDLTVMGHWSPTEHCAQAIYSPTKDAGIRSGNFVGWSQLRKTFKNENRKDERVEK